MVAELRKRVHSKCATSSIVGKLEQALARAHRTLDVERADVLPVLLQKQNQEIDGQTDVGSRVVGTHGHVTDGDGQTEDLLQLELDGSLQLLDLGDHVVT